MEKVVIAKNRIPVYSYQNPGSHGFLLSLYLRAGSMYEEEGEGGITHFLEHAVFRNINYSSGGGLYRRLDELGLEFNASTYSELVQFYISGSVAHLGEGIELLCRIFDEITLPRAEIDAERRRIKAEIREVDDGSSLAAYSAERVWCGTTLSRPITGSIGSVNRITCRRLEEYRRRVFTPENLFVYATGNLGDGGLALLTERIGEARVYEGRPNRNIAPVPEGFLHRPRVLHVKNAPFTKLRFSFDADMSRVTAPELDLLYDALLGGYSSDFFMELSERRGLIYDVSGSVERYENVGCFTFSYELRGDKLYEAVAATVDILRAITDTPLDESRCMKAGYVENAEMLLDDQRELNFTLAYDNHILSRGYSDVRARAAAYAAVTPERLSEVARTVFRPEGLVLTMKGNAKRTDRERVLRELDRLGKG